MAAAPKKRLHTKKFGSSASEWDGRSGENEKQGQEWYKGME